MGRLICWVFGHKYDVPRFRMELTKFYNFKGHLDNPELINKSINEVNKYFHESIPKPFCLNCKRRIGK